ncbi:MAG TPA: S41 family peptidase [Candidatus Paceibacterota bacterium]|nr:S41 family peptidase [Candidatus Paceibacterota bacterium]
MESTSSWKRRLVATLIILVLIGGAFGAGLNIGYRVGTEKPKTVVVQNLQNTNTPSEISADFGTFWQAWDILNQNYLRASSVTDVAKVNGAIDGLVRAAGDPYTVFFPPADNQKFQEDIEGNFGGIGAEIGMKDHQIIVIAPLKDTPAARAGLVAGDNIISINGSSTDSMTVDEAVSHIRGPEGTKVILSIYRDGWDKPKDFPIMRETISVPTLDMTMKDGNIAYVQLYSFNANANGLFFEAMRKALQQGAKGLILDLRDDPGGYLDTAVDIAGWFLPKGTLVVSEAMRSGLPQEFRSQGNGALKDFPTVVLMNKGSASASEILAGALHDDLKIKLIGEKSFGKGTVQQIFDLRDNSSIKITVAHWILPSGKTLEGEGIDPDIEVKVSEEDMNSKNDVQLTKALEVVRDLVSKANVATP